MTSPKLPSEILASPGEPDAFANVHVVPIDDLREHEPSPACWCRPREAEPRVFVHNSLDGRELYERGERLYN
jgi:hypothetical protein